MIFHPVVLVLLLLTFMVQEFIPGLQIAQHATLFLPPVFFFAAAVAVPFPVMLVLAFVTGFLWDARHLPGAGAMVSDAASLLTIGADTEIADSKGLPFGMSIAVFGLLGMLLQGIRPLFKRGRLELPVIMVGLTTAGWLFIQYATLTFLRGSVELEAMVWTKLVTDTLLAMLASPLIFLLLYSLARVSSYEIKYEGLRYRFDGR